MARNKVMNLWTAFVTAFLALCTALGLVTTNAAAAVTQTETARNTGAGTDTDTDTDSKGRTPSVTTPATSPGAWSHARSLPPTMKQRIRAEAHGKSPSCRHHQLDDAASATTDCAPLADAALTDSALTDATLTDAAPDEPAEPFATPLQR
ncbi:DUF6344 domain-containing protein [Streptomyces sp. NPDC001595]|uniref:DUF6344 domain-containing protein n=1 Tax=Streptomyces sp. NPDC001532 TaxID=3154520 RepID=UPI003321BEA6